MEWCCPQPFRFGFVDIDNFRSKVWKKFWGENIIRGWREEALWSFALLLGDHGDTGWAPRRIYMFSVLLFDRHNVGHFSQCFTSRISYVVIDQCGLQRCVSLSCMKGNLANRLAETKRTPSKCQIVILVKHNHLPLYFLTKMKLIKSPWPCVALISRRIRAVLAEKEVEAS